VILGLFDRGDMGNRVRRRARRRAVFIVISIVVAILIATGVVVLLGQ